MREKTIGYFAPQYRNEVGNIMELGDQFHELVDVFGAYARELEPQWAEKRAAVYFMYEDRPYRIGPNDLNCSDSQFAMVDRRLEDALYDMGAYEMFYSGMMD